MTAARGARPDLPDGAFDAPLSLKIRWRICRNCEHSEANHRIDGTKCLIPRFECQCPGYAPFLAAAAAPEEGT